MRLGYFTMPMHPPGRDYTQTLKEDREAVLLADRLGFCEAYIGEHVSDRCETIPSCLSFIASLAHDTKQIKLGSGTVNLPNSHPVQIASKAAMVDHMLEGRHHGIPYSGNLQLQLIDQALDSGSFQVGL